MYASWKWIPAAVAVSMLGACSTRTVTHEVVREQPIVQQPVVVAQPQPLIAEWVVQMPAAPQEAIPPAPGPGYSWVAGHYVWNGNQWVWQSGTWRIGTIRPMPAPIVETPGALPQNASRWIPGYWTIVNNDWVWVRGQWQ